MWVHSRLLCGYTAEMETVVWVHSRLLCDYTAEMETVVWVHSRDGDCCVGT